MWSCQGYIPSNLADKQICFSHEHGQPWTTKKKAGTVRDRKPPLGYVAIPMEAPTRFIPYHLDHGPGTALPKVENTTLVPPSTREFDARKHFEFDHFHSCSFDVFKLFFRMLAIFPGCFKFNKN